MTCQVEVTGRPLIEPNCQHDRIWQDFGLSSQSCGLSIIYLFWHILGSFRMFQTEMAKKQRYTFARALLSLRQTFVPRAQPSLSMSYISQATTFSYFCIQISLIARNTMLLMYSVCGPAKCQVRSCQAMRCACLSNNRPEGNLPRGMEIMNQAFFGRESNLRAKLRGMIRGKVYFPLEALNKSSDVHSISTLKPSWPRSRKMAPHTFSRIQEWTQHGDHS